MDEATLAFQALRQEVAGLRRSIEDLASRDGAGVPDYGEDLAAMLLKLGAVGERLEKIEALPVLRFTPREYTSAVERTVQQALGAPARQIKETTSRLGTISRHFQGALHKREQTKRNWQSGAVGAVAGIVVLSVLLLFATPSFINSHIAAALMGDDRWDSGWRLILAGHPSSGRSAQRIWNQAVEVNEEILSQCGEEADDRQEAVSCTITVNGLLFPRRP